MCINNEFTPLSMCMILSEQRHDGGGRRRRSEADQERHRSGPGRDGADPTHHARRRVGYEQISGRHAAKLLPLCVFSSASFLLQHFNSRKKAT